MNIEVTPTCAVHNLPLEVTDVSTTDAGGHPVSKFYVSPCEHCLSDAVATYKTDQYAGNIDRLRDERRDG